MNDIPKEINKELKELAKNSRVSIHEHFWEISQSHQLEHEELLKEAELEYDELNEWQSEKYYKLGNTAQKAGYVAIIFATTYIEAVIYNFGAIYLGDKYVKTHLDKLSSISKLCVLIKIITGKDINTDGQAYEHLNRLFKYRNSFVHSKSSPLKSNEEMMIFKENRAKNYYQAIESAKYAVEYLRKETQLLNKDEFHPGIFG